MRFCHTAQCKSLISKDFEDLLRRNVIVEEHQFRTLPPKRAIGFAIGIYFHNRMIGLAGRRCIGATYAEVDFKSIIVRVGHKNLAFAKGKVRTCQMSNMRG